MTTPITDGLEQGVEELIADLKRRAAACRELADEGGADRGPRCAGKAAAYAHAAELVSGAFPTPNPSANSLLHQIARLTSPPYGSDLATVMRVNELVTKHLEGASR